MGKSLGPRIGDEAPPFDTVRRMQNEPTELGANEHLVGVEADAAIHSSSGSSQTVVDPDLTGRSGFDPAVLHATTRRSLAALLKLESPTAVLIETDQDDLGREAALVLARAWDVIAQRSEPIAMVWPGPLVGDIAVCSTTSERWTREELDEQILSRVSRMPNHRHIVIIESAGEMDQRAYDRLLKTLEEAPSPTTFILIVADRSLLPLTVLGRIEHTVRVDAAPANERIDALVRSGANRATAETAVSLAGRAVSLAPLIVADERVAELARTVLDKASWGQPVDPVSHAVSLTSTCNHLAACWEAQKFVALPKSLTTPIRSRARIITRLGIGRHREVTAGLLRDAAVGAGGSLVGVSTPPSLGSLRARLEAADESELQLRTFASLQLVVAALFCAG